MPRKEKSDLKTIWSVPACELMKMPHEQLDALIKEAERVSVDAALAINWLVSIKMEKEAAEGKAEEAKGGKDD